MRGLMTVGDGGHHLAGQDQLRDEGFAFLKSLADDIHGTFAGIQDFHRGCAAIEQFVGDLKRIIFPHFGDGIDQFL